MNKVYCNKETDMVEQIINIDIDTNWSEDWFSNCYVVDDSENKISTYNLRYNKDTKEFEIVEGIPAKEEVEIIKQPTSEDIKKLQNENEELKTRMKKLEEALKIK